MNKLLNLLKQRAVQIILVVSTYLIVSSHLPPLVHQALYTTSIGIKDLLTWLLPLTISLFIASSVASFRKQAVLFIVTLVIFETLSNLTTVWYAFWGGHLAVHSLPPLQLPTEMGDMTPLWRLPLTQPAWWSASKGTVAGVLLGFLAITTNTPLLSMIIARGRAGAEWILTRVFARLIPLFILGFVARLQYTGLMQSLVSHSGLLLLWLGGLLTLYILGLFLLGNHGNLKHALRQWSHLLPAGGLAFSSGCSLSTMPWTIDGTRKNLRNPELAQAVIPATTNIQQVGDCITHAFLCFLLYHYFFGVAPDLLTWASFSVMFVIARFATAAILGGAIFIMLPIYERYLYFSGEMIALILAFNVILDPIITSANVMGNGALCRLFEAVWMRVQGAWVRKA